MGSLGNPLRIPPSQTLSYHSPQVAGAAGIFGVSAALHLEGNQILQLVIATLFALTADQVRSVQRLSLTSAQPSGLHEHQTAPWQYR